MVARSVTLAEPPAEYVPDFTPGQFYPEEHYQNARKAAYAGLLAGLQGVGSGYDFFAASTRANALRCCTTCSGCCPRNQRSPKGARRAEHLEGGR